MTNPSGHCQLAVGAFTMRHRGPGMGACMEPCSGCCLGVVEVLLTPKTEKE